MFLKVSGGALLLLLRSARLYGAQVRSGTGYRLSKKVLARGAVAQQYGAMRVVKSYHIDG